VSEVSVRGLTKRFGPTLAVDDAHLSVPTGTLTAVLGPSGCGKTTLLRCLSGFERPDHGTVTVDGRDITGLPAHRRRIAVVPQEGALFPHLSVARNVGYGLDRPARRGGRVAEALDLVGLAGYADRMPHELSGGQQQRVAVARALAPRPSVVLLDEPFSALDAALRLEVRLVVRAALHADGATAILVTHDQGEALSMADAVAVMRDGRIIQSGPPSTVYHEPVDPWVAGFLGEAVLLPAEVHAGMARTALGDIAVTGGGRVVLLRPEQIVLAGGGVSAVVTGRVFHGHDALLTLRLDDGTEVVARTFETAIEPGNRVGLQIRGGGRAYP